MSDDAGMNSLANLNEINYLAVIVAAIVAFGLGAVWYAPPVLGKKWMQLTGRSPENATGENTALAMGLAFLATLIGVFALALFIGKDAGAGNGALAGLVAGLGIATMSVVINGIFEAKSWLLMAINGGYQTLLFTVAGLIVGLW
jgi:hypothetical protein